METLGTRTKSARQRRLMTQDELAEKSSVRVVTISRIENDWQATQPRISTIKRIALALDVSAEWLLFGEIDERGKAAA